MPSFTDVLKWLAAIAFALFLLFCSLCCGAYALVCWVSIYFGHARHSVWNHGVPSGLVLMSLALFAASVAVAFSPVWGPKLIRGIAALMNHATKPACGNVLDKIEEVARELPEQAPQMGAAASAYIVKQAGKVGA